MGLDKRGELDSPFIHFKDPPEQSISNNTYYNWIDTYTLDRSHMRCEIESKEIKYIKRRQSRKC